MLKLLRSIAVLMLCVVGYSYVAVAHTTLNDTQYDMPSNMHLFVRFRDGFRDDTVVVIANGKEVFRQSGLSTDLTISYAGAADFDVDAPVVKLQVTVEGGPTSTKDVHVVNTPFVDVWVLEGKMELRESNEQAPML